MKLNYTYKFYIHVERNFYLHGHFKYIFYTYIFVIISYMYK
jgi:hypothetical protein